MGSRVQDLESRLVDVTDPRDKVDLLNMLAFELADYDPQQALELSERASVLARQDVPCYYDGLAESLYRHVILCLELEDYAAVLLVALEAIPLLDTLGALRKKALVLNTVGGAYLFLGDYPEALRSLLVATEIFEELGDKFWLGGVLSNVGYLYLELGDPEKALIYLERSLDLIRDVGNKKLEADALDNSCNAHYMLKEYPQALRCGLESVRLYREIAHRRGEAEALDSLGEVYWAYGDTEQATVCFQSALHISQEIGANFEATEALLRIGRLYHYLGQFEKAVSTLQRALALAEKLAAKHKLYECHQALATVYRQQGMFENALLHYEQFHVLEQAVFNEQANSRVRYLEFNQQLEAARKEAEITQLKNVALQKEVTERRLAEEAAQSLVQQMRVLAEMGREISATLDLKVVLKRIAERVKTMFVADNVAIYLCQTDGRTFQAIVTLGEYAEQLAATVFQLGEGISGHCAQSGRAEIVNQPSVDGRRKYVPGTPQEHQSMMVAPLMIQDRVLGVLTMWRALELGPFKALDLDFVVSLAQHAAVAIENARLFESAQQAREAAEAASQAKSVFLANMSHELRAPLNAILGFTQLMTHDLDLGSEYLDNLNIIERSGRHLLMLINNVLDLSKIEAGRMLLSENDFDFYKMLDDLQNMFSLRAMNKALYIVFECDPAVPRFLRGDEVKLRQILINLLGNAVKFTQKGSVTLRVTVTGPEAHLKDKDTGERLLFEVQDTGPGIAPKDLGRLFEAFVQAQAGLQAHQGAGLGLSISREFARLMGGDLVVQSELGQGATFTLDLPLTVASSGERRDSFFRQVVALEPRQPVYRILVADSEHDNNKLLVKLLAPLGFEVREALDGQSVVDIWRAWSPHLIWLGVRIPGLGSQTVVQHIKSTCEEETTSPCPVIVALLTQMMETELASMRAIGWDDFVLEPFQEAEIFDIMQKWLAVRFVYADALDVGTGVGQDNERLRFSDLQSRVAQLPSDLIEDLDSADLRTNMVAREGIVGTMQAYDADLAAALARLANNFEYKTILSLIRNPVGES